MREPSPDLETPWHGSLALAGALLLALGCGQRGQGTDESEGTSTLGSSTTGASTTEEGPGETTDTTTESGSGSSDTTDSETGEESLCGEEQCAEAVLIDGLVGYWPFVGSADDVGGHDQHGAVNGATLTTDRAGRADCAYSFDGVDDFIKVADSEWLDLHDALTVAAWTRHDSQQQYQSIVDKLPEVYPYGNLGGYRITWFPANPMGNNLELYDQDGQHIVYPDALNGWDAWTHVAATWDGTTMRLYENGVEVASGPYAGTLPSSGGDLYIGISSVTGGGMGNLPSQGHFHGSIDEVVVYDRALSPAEVQAIHACQPE